LAWLLQPPAVPTFLDTVWGARHYHVKRGCAGYFDSLLHGPSAVEELLECFRREPCLEVVVADVVRTVEHPSVIAESLDALEDALVRRGRCPPVG
jgi:hypothetical protein